MADVIDYIIEQADRTDGHNLQIEQDLIFLINKNVDLMISKCLSSINTGISNQIQLEFTVSRLTKIIKDFTSATKNIMLDKAQDYEQKAYKDTNNLIEVGKEVSGNYTENVKEISVKYDKDTIDYIQKYAFELLTGYSTSKIQEIRSKLGYLLLSGKGDKAHVRALVEKVLNTNKSKSEEIAQQELSMAYNHGVLRRMHEYANISGEPVQKYWHGFKYSSKTCEYCRERIGSVYDLDDNSETLPAHVRCRCTWLPILKSWNGAVTNRLLSRANLLNTAYSIDAIYQRINSRLGIKYAEYLDPEAAKDYVSGDRSTKMAHAMNIAKNNYISDKVKSFNIPVDTTNGPMSKEYNQQMKFWKRYVATAMADNNNKLLDDCVEAIKGVTLLPWTAHQIQGWNTLISEINNNK